MDSWVAGAREWLPRRLEHWRTGQGDLKGSWKHLRQDTGQFSHSSEPEVRSPDHCRSKAFSWPAAGTSNTSRVCRESYSRSRRLCSQDNRFAQRASDTRSFMCAHVFSCAPSPSAALLQAVEPYGALRFTWRLSSSREVAFPMPSGPSYGMRDSLRAERVDWF
jgi:hypothetical protein